MNVVPEVRLIEDEDGDVTHGAQVSVLANLVLDEPLIEDGVENPLHYGWLNKTWEKTVNHVTKFHIFERIRRKVDFWSTA